MRMRHGVGFGEIFQLWFIFMDFVTGVTALEFDTVTSGTVYSFSSVLHGT